MAKVQNVSGDERYVPALGGRLVLPDQIVEVPDEDAEGFTCQTDVWAIPSAKKAATKKESQ